MQYYGNGTNNGSHVPFNFHLITELDGTSRAPDFENVVNTWINAMPAGSTANWVVSSIGFLVELFKIRPPTLPII